MLLPNKKTLDFSKNAGESGWTLSFVLSASFQDFLDLIPEAAIISNEKGEILVTNKEAQQVFQHSKQSFLRANIEEYNATKNSDNLSMSSIP